MPSTSTTDAVRSAVLYCNLGTPDEPTPGAVRRYLAEFLADPRVVEIPRALWLPLLYGVILPLRASKSAAKYRSIWLPEGSPLQVWTQRQALRLQGWLGEKGHRVKVVHAMRYGKPSIASQLDALMASGVTRIVVLTAYPQYSATTVASVIDAVSDWTARQRKLPELRFVNSYHDDPGYIEALQRRIERHWRENGRAEHLVMSFHGIPERCVNHGDPYLDECKRTAQKLAMRLNLDDAAWSMTFQSRFGKAKWLEPYTEPTVQQLARRGVKRLDIVCPGFPADCLETLEEIAMEVRDAFIAAGGKDFRYIPCLNDDAAWIAALGGIAAGALPRGA
ncbi:ferrochelatase [Ramlibacter sp.]|uniref:ferrochelatase n=1 Tax=Ramlibacter sp. TaxID=1917967 RepID=UPI003D148D67